MKKGPPAVAGGPFFVSEAAQYERAADLFAGGIVIRTTSPFCPGKPVKIACTKPGGEASSRFVLERASAQPSKSGRVLPFARIWSSSWL